jgi:GNAT superfamily N-acetyltransferase
VERSVVNLDEVRVRRVERNEEALHRQLMAAHHYLGFLPKIGHTLWYVATYQEQWVGLLIFSAAAWKCAVRDRWIGWDFHHQYDYDRLKLIANNSRFLILPDWHRPNLGSKILSLCQKRLSEDWQKRFGHRLLLLETFVDPQRFHGTVYRAANWTYLGLTQGYRRTRQGYSPQSLSPKKVFVKPLQTNARTLLARRVLPLPYRQGVPKIMLSAQQMRSLPDFFVDIPDPRRAQGRRHPLCTVLAIACGATLCGMRGYKAIADWAQSLSPKARQRLGCRRVNGRYVVPSESIIRNVIIRVAPTALDRALQRWNQAYGQQDTIVAIDGKTMCNALDQKGHQTHVMSVVGHHTKTCYTQKKLALFP